MVKIHDRVAEILALILHDAAVEHEGDAESGRESQQKQEYFHGVSSLHALRSTEAPPFAMPE